MTLDVDMAVFDKGFLEGKEIDLPEKEVVEELQARIVQAVKARIPKEKFGILFSGGVDSTLLALICKQAGADFVCYTSALDDDSLGESQDLVWASRVASKLALNHKIITLNLKETETTVKEIITILPDPSVMNVGVGIAEYLVCKQAKEDGIKILFSGLGSEELFGGYDRHAKAEDLLAACIEGFLQMPERDLARQTAVTDACGVELRLPLLDPAVVQFGMHVPNEQKIGTLMDQPLSKIALRKVALGLGLYDEFALRKKTAAQYGSKFDRALEKLAKQSGFKRKDEYIASLHR